MSDVGWVLSRASGQFSRRAVEIERWNRNRVGRNVVVARESTWSVADLLGNATQRFVEAGTPEPRLSAEHLLAASLETSRSELWKVNSISAARRAQFARLCHRRRVFREPVQYLVGNWDFHEITLFVEKPILIPRPETEELVDIIIRRWERVHGRSPGAILDIGCGTGAIGLSLAKHFPESKVTLLDLSTQAVQLTSRNANLVLGSADLTRINIVLDSIATFPSPPEKFDLVVSNPPYIPMQDMAALAREIQDHEDPRALCGGPDGTFLSIFQRHRRPSHHHPISPFFYQASISSESSGHGSPIFSPPQHHPSSTSRWTHPILPSSPHGPPHIRPPSPHFKISPAHHASASSPPIQPTPSNKPVHETLRDPIPLLAPLLPHV